MSEGSSGPAKFLSHSVVWPPVVLLQLEPMAGVSKEKVFIPEQMSQVPNMFHLFIKVHLL
jgi:hypothetical protein